MDHPVENSPRLGKSTEALLYTALLLAAVLPYLNTLAFSFVYDDDYQVVANPYLRSFHYLKQILITPVWSFKYATVATNYYRPLMSLEYLLTYQIYGPLAYVFHLESVLLHTLVVILFFIVTRRLFESEKMAFLSAAIFALHPIHTENVAWVAGIPDLQLSAFLLCALWFYLDYGEPARRKWWTPIALCVSFMLALLSKEPAIALPVIAVAYEHFLRADRLTTTWTQKLGRYAILWGVAGVYLVARAFLIGGLIPRVHHAMISWPVVFLSAVSMFGDYMNKLVWPANLQIFSPFVPSVSLLNPAVIAGAAWIVGLAFLCGLLWKRKPLLILGILLMVGTIAPTLNARWLPGSVFAERYLYVPSMGFSWLAASGVVALWNAKFSRRRLWARTAIAIVLIALTSLSVMRIISRNEDWRSDLTLFSAAVKQFPDSSTMHSNLGGAYFAMHRDEDAIREWNLALALDPNNAWALSDLGMIDRIQKRYSESLPLLQRAISISPQFTDALLNLAETLAALGQNQEAEKEFQTATKNSPLNWLAQIRFANFYMSLDRPDAARERYLASVAAMPSSDAMDGLGDIALERGQIALAEQYFRQGADLDEYDHHAHYQLVCIYGASGRVGEAKKEFKLGQATDIGTDPLEQKAKAVIEKLNKP